MNQTTGCLNYVLCPYCDKPIRSLRDSGAAEGDVIECEHCARKVTVVNIETVVYVTLGRVED